MLFEKKVTIYKKKDRETWEQIRDVLKAGGLKGVSASHYAQDVVRAGGCGAKLDPRDFGAKGKADHDIYYIKVREADADRARELILQNGLVAEVKSSEELMQDASLRARAAQQEDRGGLQ